MSGEQKSIGARLRDLFTSRHTRYLEEELVRCRMEYQATIRELRSQLERQPPVTSPAEASLNRQWVEWLKKRREIMQSAEPGASVTFAEELEKHNRVIEELERQEEKCRFLSPSPNPNGRAAAARSPKS